MVLEGATFGGHHIFGRVKAKCRGAPSLWAHVLPKEVQAIDLEEDLGQIPRSKGEYC